jgi:hypothetical protein
MAESDYAAALKSYTDSRAIIDQLAKSDPGSAEWQRDLAASYIKVGDVPGDLAGSLKSYSDSLTIIDQFAKSEPGNTGWQGDLCVLFAKIGDVQKEQRDLAEALASYKAWQKIAAALAGRYPANPEWQRDLSSSRDKIEELLLEQRRERSARGGELAVEMNRSICMACREHSMTTGRSFFNADKVLNPPASRTAEL